MEITCSGTKGYKPTRKPIKECDASIDIHLKGLAFAFRQVLAPFNVLCL